MAKGPAKTRKPRNVEIPNQVFLAIPWRNVRAKYEWAISKLRKQYPLSFVIVGREDGQDAEDLFEVIKTKILASSYVIFDATGGNANVSLEYGFAEANDVPRALYLSTHKAAKRATDAPIIADLAGKRRNQYAQVQGLLKLLRDFCDHHPYTRRFEQFLAKSGKRRDKGAKKRMRALCLKIIHTLDRDGTARRHDVVQELMADQSRYSRGEIDDMIRRMHTADLIESVQGPYSTVSVT